MKTFDQIYDTAEDKPPFSNGMEGEAWMSRWCYECVHDTDNNCQLVTIAFTGRTPAEWISDKPFSLGERYRCIDFEAIESP